MNEDLKFHVRDWCLVHSYVGNEEVHDQETVHTAMYVGGAGSNSVSGVWQHSSWLDQARQEN